MRYLTLLLPFLILTGCTQPFGPDAAFATKQTTYRGMVYASAAGESLGNDPITYKLAKPANVTLALTSQGGLGTVSVVVEPRQPPNPWPAGTYRLWVVGNGIAAYKAWTLTIQES